MVTSKFFRHKPKNPHFTPTSVSDPPGGPTLAKAVFIHVCSSVHFSPLTSFVHISCSG